MGEVELMALYWTVSGPVEVHVGREWSLFDWRDRCAEAAKVGFKGLGLWHADVAHQLETRTLDEMAKIFDDAGLKYLEVEFLWRVLRRHGRAGARRVRPPAQAAVRDRRRVRRPPHQGRQHPRHAVRARPR